MPFERFNDPVILRKAMEVKPDVDFDVEEWIADENNIAFRSGDDVGLFQYEYPGLYTGHYFFSKQTRGKAAKLLAQEMVNEMFLNKGTKVIRGLVLLTNLASRWMTRHLGFLSYGVVDTEQGPCELFLLTPDRFYHKMNEKD